MTGAVPADRRLWAGGPVASPLGVGTWQWGDRNYWGFGRDYGDEQVAATYRAARNRGMALFDTAEVYGKGISETLLGRSLCADPDPARVVLATKFAPLPWRLARRGSVRRALEASLTRLGVPRIALYQLHFRLPVLGDRRWLTELAEAQQEGLIDAVGVSNYGPAALRSAHRALGEHGVRLATNQVEFSLLQRRPERSGLLALCAELDVAVIAYSPLAQGLLTGKYGAGRPPPGARRMRHARRLAEVDSLVASLARIGAAHGGKTPGQVALNWVLRRGALAIPGAKSAEQAEANAGAIGWALTDEEMDVLGSAGGPGG